MRVELNGTQILEKRTENEHQFAEFQTDIELVEGVNHLAVYVEKNQSGFGFTALLCNDFGDTLRDITYSTDQL